MGTAVLEPEPEPERVSFSTLRANGRLSHTGAQRGQDRFTPRSGNPHIILDFIAEVRHSHQYIKCVARFVQRPPVSIFSKKHHETSNTTNTPPTSIAGREERCISFTMMKGRILVALCALLPYNVIALAATKARSSGGTGFGAASSTQVVADESAEISALRAFLMKNKAELDHVQVGRHKSHGRGLFATKSFNKPGKIICRIPSDCALALSDPAEQGKDVPTIAHNGANLLKLYMKNEAKRQQWAAYLDTLPNELGLTKTPDFMELEEIELLEFPSLVKAAKERKEQIAQVAAETGYSLEEVQFATWLVASRSFPLGVAAEDELVEEGDTVLQNIEVDDRGQIMAKAGRSYIRLLFPWIDLANHDSNSPNAVSAVFKILSKRRIPLQLLSNLTHPCMPENDNH
eukprot:scaffold1049_cov168-Amphora_coffeaeformis.AAC.1